MEETNPLDTIPETDPVEPTTPPVTAAPMAVTAVGVKPRVGGGSDDAAWVGGSNVTTSRRSRPSSTLARRPTDFKSASQIEQNSIQHKDYIVKLRATKAFKSPLLRSRDDRCRTIRGVKTFPERY
jgi:hypothetical protein